MDLALMSTPCRPSDGRKLLEPWDIRLLAEGTQQPDARASCCGARRSTWPIERALELRSGLPPIHRRQTRYASSGYIYASVSQMRTTRTQRGTGAECADRAQPLVTDGCWYSSRRASCGGIGQLIVKTSPEAYRLPHEKPPCMRDWATGAMSRCP